MREMAIEIVFYFRDGGDRMPTLDWIGKSRVVNHHLNVPYHVLERVYSFDEGGRHEEDNGSGNMIIHGDKMYRQNMLCIKL